MPVPLFTLRNILILIELLPERLRAELPGILAWALDGCAKWQTFGLGEPAAVMAATNEYQAESDAIARYIDERCVVAPNATVPG